ncbi:hypothetical protein MXD59_19095 [Frankia sp. Ag45/Mut15]|uniref:Uncharacterized protein n=1 Tax=Frankia umida TaxID=573489 RepID=A0ABT0K2Y8_9ACTN|nr:hypothetical protein [Frankia umida]MCK9877857.1 hypothetical protein [Frankia umida]
MNTPDTSLPQIEWHNDVSPPVLSITAAPHGEFLIQIAGLENRIRAEPPHGELVVTTASNDERHLQCPRCTSGAGLTHQEWLYSSRPVLGSQLHRVHDPDSDRALWFITIAGHDDQDSAFDLAGATAARFYCRFCARGYTLPADVHFDVAW